MWFFLIDQSFQWVNRLSVSLFKDEGNRIVRTGYCLSKAEIKDYKDIIDGKNFLDM